MLATGTFKKDGKELLVFRRFGYSVPFYVMVKDAREIHVIESSDGKYFVYEFEDGLQISIFDKEGFASFLKEKKLAALLESEEVDEKNKIVIGSQGKQYFVYKGEGHVYGGKLHMDFLFPNGNGIFPSEHRNHLLRDAVVPWTEVITSNKEILRVIWVIEREDGYIHVTDYPFNTSNMVCSRLNDLIRKRLKVSVLNWYAEPPGNDIPSIKIEYMPVLAYALKRDVHELIPFLEKKRFESTSGNKYVTEDTLRFDIEITFSSKKKDKTVNYKLELPLKVNRDEASFEGKLLEFALKKTGSSVQDKLELFPTG